MTRQENGRCLEHARLVMTSTHSRRLPLILIASLLTGCATGGAPRQIRATDAAALTSDWSRVMQVAPASQIQVQTRSAPSAERHFVAANDSGLTLLNLGDASLPREASRALLEMAAEHPEYFGARERQATFARASVRIGRDGVFVGNRRVADYEHVIETLARRDVLEIRGPVIARGSVPGALLGGWIGFAVGVLPGLGGASSDVAWLAVTGAAAVGGYLGHRWSSHRTQGVIYRAP